MKSFNLNDSILVQITEYGMNELIKQVGQEYFNICILPKKKIINDKDWYELQAHAIPNLFGNMLWMTHPYPIEPQILIPEIGD